MSGDKDDKKILIEIRHFQSSSGGKKNKQMVVEKVTADSETARFLARMEQRRLMKACQQAIDLRGRVDAECQKYVYMMQTHFMDETSHKTFCQRLKENKGVFTIGAFEAIINASHVKKISGTAPAAKKPAAPAKVPAATKAASVPPAKPTAKATSATETTATAPAATTSTTKAKLAEDYFKRPNPEILPFGYFRRRRDARLLYASDVTLHVSDDNNVSARTKDISVGGTLVAVNDKNAQFTVNQTLRMSYQEISKQQADAPTANIAYRIAKIENAEKETLLTLVRQDRDDNAAFNSFLTEFIAKQSARNKFDPEDELCTATALCYQRVYTETLSHLPLFMRLNETGRPFIHSVGITPANQFILDFFSDGELGHDLSALCLPERLNHLCFRLAAAPLKYQDGGESPVGEAILVAYRDKSGKVHTATDFECKSPEQLRRLIHHAVQQKSARIFKLSASLVREHNLQKMDELAQSLSQKSADEAKTLRDEVRGTFAVGMLSDITETITDLDNYQGVKCDPVQLLDGLEAWHREQKLALSPHAAATNPIATVTLLPKPRLVQFGFWAKRREDRYLAKTKIELEANGQRTPGLTRDLSTRGLCIMLESAGAVKPGDEVLVGFLSFTKENYQADILNIPYRVIKAYRDDVFYVVLERVKNAQWDGITDFFNEIIDINKQKMGTCINDVLSTAQARLYEDLLSTHLLGTPFFVGQDANKKYAVRKIAVSVLAPELADFFYAGQHEMDYRGINTPALLQLLNDRLATRGKNKASETILDTEIYLYKEIDAETGKPVMRTAFSFDFTAIHEKLVFINKARASGSFRFFRTKLVSCQPANKPDLESVIGTARNASRARTAQLEQELGSMAAAGELCDITNNVIAMLTI